MWLGSIICLLICVDENDKGYIAKLRKNILLVRFFICINIIYLTKF